MLDDVGVEYCLGRSLVSSAYCIARASAVADPVADLPAKHRDLIREAIDRRDSFNVVPGRTIAASVV